MYGAFSLATLYKMISRRVGFGSSSRFLTYFIALHSAADASATTTPASFMNGDLIVQAPAQGDPVFNFVQGIGAGIGDTAAQGLRFSSNILRLDPLGALGNIGNIFDNRSFDSILVQFAERLPEVIDQGLHRTSKPKADGTIATYLSDGTLTTKEAGELLAYMLNDSDQTPAEKESALKSMEEMVYTLKSGAPNLSTKDLGQRLGQSMKNAIKAAPKPVPIIGSPMNKKRILSIQKGFFHSFIQDLGPTYVRGTLKDPLKSLRDKGLEVSPISDDQIKQLIDQSVNNLELNRCYTLARSNDDLLACARHVEKNKNRVIGETIATATPWLRNGSLRFSLKVAGSDKVHHLNQSVLEVIDGNQKAVHALRTNGDHRALNHLGNETARRVSARVGGEYVDQWADTHVSDPEKAHALKSGSQTLINSFARRVELIPGDTKDLQKYLGTLSDSSSLEDANNPIDSKLRTPFEQTVLSAEGKSALLEIFLSQSPFNEGSKDTFRAIYDKYLEEGAWPLSLNPDINAQLKFLVGFDDSITLLAKVPPNKSTLAHVRSIADLSSPVLRESVMAFSPGTSELFEHLTSCDGTSSSCQILNQEYQKVINHIREIREALAKSNSFEQCDGRFKILVHKALSYSQDRIKEIAADPLLLIKSYGDNESQETLNCYTTGLALKGGFPLSETKRLFSALERESTNNPARRTRMMDELYGYMKHKDAPQGQEHKRDLLALMQDTTRTLAKDYVDQHIDAHAQKSDVVAQAFAGEEGNRITKDIVHRFVDNTNIFNPNTTENLDAHLKQVTSSSPTKANSHIDRALQEGLDSTLKDPQTRKDFLRLALEFNSPEASGKAGLLGPALEKQLLEAYEAADFSQNPPRFPPNTPKGVASALRGFDQSVQTLSQKRGQNESVLSFFRRVASPNSRILDSLLAENSTGATDLFMSMVKCDGTNDDLCRGCLGTQGNWILPGKKGTAPQVLLSAPAGQVVNYLRLGMSPQFNQNNTKKCHAAIPSFVESVIKQAGDPKNTDSILRDPSNFLEALKQPTNQTAFNCIIANYAEKNVLRDIRSKGIGFEAGMRSLLEKTGVSRDSGLYQLTGDSLFETFERHNSNAKMLELKANFVDSTRAVHNEDNTPNRHNLRSSTADLLTGGVLATLSDPEFSHLVLAGTPVPRARLEAKKNAWAKVVLQCIERKYSESLAPAALWASEDIASKFKASMGPWVEAPRKAARASKPEATNPTAVRSPAAPSALEVCADSAGASASAIGAPISKTTSATSSLGAPAVWVGGYDHTLRLQQEIVQGQGRATLSASGQSRIIAGARDYRTFLNHLQTRRTVVGKSGGVTGWAGDRIFEFNHTAEEAVDVVNDARKALSFPEEKIISKLDAYIANPSPKNMDDLLKLINKHCPSSSDYNRLPKSGAARINESGNKSH